jgi:hypothetical protein
MFSRKPRPSLQDSEHTPLLAMWYQTRTALAELIIPLLAGLKTMWLLFVAPTRFFEVAFHRTRPLESLRSPFDPFWRTLTSEERKPLDPAHFLLFGIFAAALANFEFDNSNRLAGLLGNGETGLLSTAVTALSNLLPSLSGRLEVIQAFFQGEFVDQLQTFIDPSLTAVVSELIINLLLLLIFTYLFYLLIGRRIPAVYSYAFWLYVAGMQFVTTAVSRVLFNFISLPTFNLPQITPDIIFVIIETGLLILWYFLYPAWVLPRVFPNSITRKQVLIAAILGRGIMAIAGWLIFGGFVLIASFIGNT